MFENNAAGSSTNILGSGGKLPGSRAMRIESRKGILSRKSSVNKNSFYKQKGKDFLPNKLYGSGSPPSNGGIGQMGVSGNRGASSYFNKGGPMGSAGGNTGLPSLGNTKGNLGASGGGPPGLGSYGAGGYNKNSAVGGAPAGGGGPTAFPSYKYGGLGGGIAGGLGGGIGSTSGVGADPYHPNY